MLTPDETCLHTLTACFFKLPFLASAQPVNDLVFTVGIVSDKAKVKSKGDTLCSICVRKAESPRLYLWVGTSLQQLWTTCSCSQNGSVQIATATPFNAVTLERESNSQVLAVRWKRDSKNTTLYFHPSRQWHSFLGRSARQNAHFRESQLHQQLYLPAITLLNQGEKLEYLRSIDDHPTKDRIGYLFWMNIWNNPTKSTYPFGCINSALPPGRSVISTGTTQKICQKT